MDDEIGLLLGIGVSNDAAVDIAHPIISQSHGRTGHRRRGGLKGYLGCSAPASLKRESELKLLNPKI